MVWFRTDDSFYDHPKVVSIPRAERREAVGTWLLAGTWCAKHLTDGVLPIHQVEELGGSLEGALALVKARLWTKTKTEFRFKSWAEYQPTRAQVEAARESERTRKARQRAKPTGSRPDSGPSPDGSPAPVPPGHTVRHQQVSGHPVPSRPDPTQITHVIQSSPVPERESYPQDDDERAATTRRDAYWRGLRISNPPRIVAAIARATSRDIDESQALQVVTAILERSKVPPANAQAYVEAAVAKSWVEIQNDLDRAAVSA